MSRFAVLVALTLALALPFAAAGPMPISAAGSLAGKSICIDPGHGGSETGAVYEKRGRNGWLLNEKTVNLDVSLALAGQLTAADANVILTRISDADVSLEQRVATCNAAGSDILISVHTNSTYTSRWDGSNTLISGPEDNDLATSIHAVMYNGLKEGWSGRFTDYGVDSGDWYVPLHATMPAVILEPVFMSNDAEASALRATITEAPNGRRAQIARVEFEGIVAYFSAH